MRILIFILSILVFRQAVTVCGVRIQKDRITMLGLTKDEDCVKSFMKHSCCSKKKSDTSQENKDNAHKCKCVGSATAVINAIALNVPLVFHEKKIDVQRPFNPSLHPFDFHAKISYPPQLI